MDAKASYAVEIVSSEVAGALKDTVQIFQSASEFLANAINDAWEDISSVPTKNRARFNYTEHLMHAGETTTPSYDFDGRFPDFPCYLRRSCITKALGIVSSYRSNHKNWVDNGRVGGEPQFQSKCRIMPSFYGGNMFKNTSYPDIVKLNLLVKGKWTWVKVRLKKTDVDYLQKYWFHVVPSSPTLEKRSGKYYLKFLYKEGIKLSEKPLMKQRICAVDLGINTDAVCCIMESDGTVLARKFIDFPSEKAKLYAVLGRVKKLQRKYGSRNGGVKQEWTYASALNEELARLISKAIVDFAVAWNVDYVVFEHLGMSGKMHGKNKQRLAMWKKSSIQQHTEDKAHWKGIHISRICAWGTSKLAFDGSGTIIRGRKSLTNEELAEILELRSKKKAIPKDGRPETYTNNQTCTFPSGKEYNCDLSASYNIGARYFIRGIMNDLSAKQKEFAVFKVPDLSTTPKRTLSTLRALNGINWDELNTAKAA